MKNPTKEQVKEWNRTYYLKHKDKIIAKNNEDFQKLRKWYKDLKKTLKCEKCGFSNPAALAFHHRDGEDKKSDICDLVCRRFSIKVIEEEISKCEVLCHNCHAVHHYSDNF